MTTKIKNKIVGIMECKKTVLNDEDVQIQERWVIPAFKQGTKNILLSPRIDEISSAKCQLYFKLNMNEGITYTMFPSQYNEITNISFFYTSDTEILLKSVELYMFREPNYQIYYTKAGPEQFTPAVDEANAWHLFKTLDFDHELSDSLGEYDTVILQFNIQVSIESQFHFPATQFNSDFENLFLEGLYSDIVMKSADDEEFRVHKAVLANRCAVLKAHFEHNTTESIVESHLDSAVLRQVLSFIYTDKSPKLDEISDNLLAAADHYQLSRLKGFCEVALYKKLNANNALDTLQLARLHNANALKQLSLEFIRRDFRTSKTITKTEGWANKLSPDLMKDVLE